jgi:microcystin-dependent protein
MGEICRRRLLRLAVAAASCGILPALSACGGAGNPDFALAPAANTVTVPQGAEATLSVAVQAVKGSQGSITLVLNGLPSFPNTNPPVAAVAVAPGQATVGIGSSQQFTLIAAPNAPLGTTTLQALGVSGAVMTASQITHTVNVTLVVAPGLKP